MSERRDLTDLTELFHLATDGIDSPGLAHAALRTARQRRTRRRGAAVAAVAASVVGVVVLGVYAGENRSGGLAPSTQTSTPSAPTTTPSAPETNTTPVPQEKTWPKWNPRDVDDLPPAADRVAPALPEVINPPDSSPAIVDDPVDTAVAVVAQENLIQVLGTDNDWRTVPVEDQYPQAMLSPGGTRLSVTYYAKYDTGATIHDLGTGESWVVPFPDDYRPFDGTTWTFVDEDTLLLQGGTAWLVDVRTGAAERLPEGIGGGLSTAVDPLGGLLVSAQWGTPNILVDYAEGAARKVSMQRTGRLSALRADTDTVVGTSYDGRPFAVVVADRSTLTPKVSLPIVDTDANYSNGGLGTLALTDDGTVLLRVAMLGRDVQGLRVVAWDPTTGDLSLVSRTDETAAVDFAEDLLRASGGQR